MRATELKRKTPLQARTPLSRGGPLRPNARAREAGENGDLPRKTARRDTGPSARARALVLERDGWACVCCGRSIIGQVYSLQHRKRRSQGGSNRPTNLLTVLGDGTTLCHARIDSRIDPHDEAQGYTVRSFEDPAEVPVMVHSEHGSGVLVWLLADGTYGFEAPGRKTA